MERFFGVSEAASLQGGGGESILVRDNERVDKVESIGIVIISP